MKNLLAAAALIFAATPATARDPLVGDWGGSCRPDLQCWIEIRNAKGGGYRVRYVAANSMDASKVVCDAKGSVKAVPGTSTILAGRFARGQRIEILSGRGEIVVGATDNEPCGRPLAVNGVYQAIGD
ncbi:hypothetical protein ACFOYU_06100 [Microvirga sp. GCM10011540]|uniref:hypothetical protein n=1 Tax=Microvirga sp. GCM10011540 TaxID=3317338 RepID=UPI003605E9EB